MLTFNFSVLLVDPEQGCFLSIILETLKFCFDGIFRTSTTLAPPYLQACYVLA